MATEPDEAIDTSWLDEILEAYAGQSGALIPILQKAQEHYGYLPIQVLQHIADSLHISLGKVFGVATFYAQFYLQRRGRHVIRVCDGTACHVKGAPALLTAIHDEYGIEADGTTEDSQLTLEVVYCLGSCALAPVAVVDGQVMGRMRHETLLRHVKRELGTG